MDFLARAETFVRVVEAGSLSAAARAMRLSLPAISRQIASLEDELGTSLLLRTTRSLQVTDEGRRFHEQAVRLVQSAEAARASVRKAGALAGDVVLSASVTLGTLRIIPALPRLLSKHKDLRLELRLEDRAADLVSEGVDVAVRAGMTLPDSPHLIAEKLAVFPRWLVASPAYLKSRGTPKSFAAVAGHAAIVGSQAPARWRARLEGDQVPLKIALRVETLIGIRAAAVAGIGLAVLPNFVVAEEIAAGKLTRLLQEVELEPVNAHALYRVERRGSPAIAALIAHLARTMPA